MTRVFNLLRQAQISQRDYFTECSEEISLRNLHLVRLSSFSGAVLFVLYFAFTGFFYPEWSISPLYGLIVPVFLFFYLESGRLLNKEALPESQSKALTLFFYYLVLAFLIVLSVFPHPAAPSVFYPLFLVLSPVMFLFPAFVHIGLTLASLALMFALVLNFKAPACWYHELFEDSTAAIFALLATLFMMQYRLQTDRLKEKYFHLSRTDLLTGTMNKAAGQAEIAAYLARRRRGECCAVLFLDIDGFKELNDACGHMEGDHFLKELGETLSALCREDDIVSRFGGDEFLILLKQVPGPETAMRRGNAILEAVRKLRTPGGQPVTCSIGAAFCPAGPAGADTLIAQADAALYRAKARGKNLCILYEKEH